MWRHTLDRSIHEYYGSNWSRPFDQDFHLVLNVAIGGWFLDGPDEDDVWSYPEAEMWVDSVTVWPLDYIIDPEQTTCKTSEQCDNCRPDTGFCAGKKAYTSYVLKDGTFEGTCAADETKSATELCWSLKWYCHDPNAQNTLDLTDTHCGPGWNTIGCCYAGNNGASCGHDDVVSDLTDVLTAWFAKTGECGGSISDLNVECAAEPG